MRSSPGGFPAWLSVGLLIIVLVLVGWFVGARLLAGEPAASPSGAAPSTPSTPTPAASTTDPAAPATPTPPAGEPSTPADLPRLTPDQPRRLVIEGLVDTGFDIAIDSSGGRLLPASDTEVSRWAERGSPGSPGEDTVVIAGTAGDAQTPFARIDRVRPGTEISIRTDQGLLTYTVTSTADVPSESVTDAPALAGTTPGRLVLVVQKYADSGDLLAESTLIVAVLTGAAPA